MTFIIATSKLLFLKSKREECLKMVRIWSVSFFISLKVAKTTVSFVDYVLKLNLSYRLMKLLRLISTASE